MIQFLSNPAVAWPLVFIATIIEIVWFIAIKKASGLEVWPWNMIQFILLFIDIPLLSFALKTLPAGSVYAFWTGASAVAIAILGIVFFGESLSSWRLVFIALVIIGLVGIQLTTK
jgi:quaternary ammonium compound-resistance protein SugE